MPKQLYFKPFVGFFLVLFYASQSLAQPDVAARADSTIRAYIDAHKGFAIAEMRRTGIPASVTLGQAICESRYGTSKVAMQAHNHFGIKCYDTWQGKRYFHKDDERKNGVLVPSCFRYYTSDSASYADHSAFLMTRPWYDFLFKYASDDYMSWIKGLNKAGYANAKDYDERILKHIKNYELYKLDEKGYPLQPRKTEKIAANTPNKGGKTNTKPEKEPKKPSDAVFIAKDTSKQIAATTVKKVAVQPSLPPSKKDPKSPVFIAKDTSRQAAKTVAMNVMPPNIPDKIPSKTTAPPSTNRLAAFGNTGTKTTTNTTTPTATIIPKTSIKTDTTSQKTIKITAEKTPVKDTIVRTIQATIPQNIAPQNIAPQNTTIQDSIAILKSAPDKIVHDTAAIVPTPDTLKQQETEQTKALKNKLQRFKTVRTAQPAADSTLKTATLPTATDTLKSSSRFNINEPTPTRTLAVGDAQTTITAPQASSIDTKPNAIAKKTHTIIANDTYYSIAKKYGISLDQLIELNGLSSKSAKIGDVLRLE